MGADLDDVALLETGYEDLGEAVEERLGQTLPAGAVSRRILGAEDDRGALVDCEYLVQLGNEDLAAMVEAGIQTLEDGLGG